jgi:hypothetical protein
MNFICFKDSDPMSETKRASWLKRTCRNLSVRIREKFALGRAQYDSDIGSQTVEFLLDQMEQEAIDQLMYVRELKRRVQEREDLQGLL